MTPEHKRIDTNAFKSSINLVEFARRYTNLREISRTGEFAGACPLCGGQDRFHVKGEHFYCRQCYPRGGDVINLVQLVHKVSFVEACQLLSIETFSFPEKLSKNNPPAQVQPEHMIADWQNPAYQDSARKTIVATHRLLTTAEGTSGQDYLFSRGLTKETWGTYLLGYGHTIHPTRRQNMETIFIPWLASDGKTITAIQHRFIDLSLEKAERYTMKPGSEPRVFGLQALAPAHTLTIVEGEFNCMSLHQVGQQAVSVGSEANINHLTHLSEYLPSYERLLIWFDKPELGQQVASWLDQSGLFRKEKTQIVWSPLDANESLVKGELSNFVATFKEL